MQFRELIYHTAHLLIPQNSFVRRYTSAPGERSIVTGGVEVPPSLFSPWSGGVAGVVRADLASLNISTTMLGSMQ